MRISHLSSRFNILRLRPWRWFQPRSTKALALLFSLGLCLSFAIAACSPNTETATPTQTQTLRIGYQKASTVLNLLKNRGDLEKRLAPQGVSVEWNEFAAGPQMLEALNVGSIDFAYTGETPPIFAQAAGAPLVYVAYEPWGPAGEAILVKKDSPIQRIADLKGKKVALNRGSNVHYLLVRALESAGLQYSDIEPAFLPPGDARPAFEQGSVDAWVIWDPFQAAAETAIGARVLVDGQGLVDNRGFFLSTQTFSQQQPELLQALLEELKTVSEWAQNNPTEVAQCLSAELGIDVPSLELAEKRRGYGVLPISDEVVAGQQKIADTFLNLGLIPQEIAVKSAVAKS